VKVPTLLRYVILSEAFAVILSEAKDRCPSEAVKTAFEESDPSPLRGLRMT
jgi:hypothetical protein